MTLSRFNPEKPIAITALCIIGLINATQMINLILSPMAKQLGTIYPLYFSVSVVVSLACIIGLWFLKRWAALVYGVILVCNQVALLGMGLWELSAAVIPIIIIGVLFKYLDKMV